MNNNRATAYRASEFADMAGVTVRALHHYDRLGLLKPHRTESGYRLYLPADLERLEQIVALKFLGMPLKQIKTLLERDGLELPDALRMQRLVLEEKRRLLDSAIHAIQEAEAALGSVAKAASVSPFLTKIIEVIEMQENADWMWKYQSEEAKAKLKARPPWTPELQERVSRQWMELMAEVESILDEDPAGEKAQALAARWIALVEEFTGGDPEITAGVRRLYADEANWPETAKQQMKPFMNKEVWSFMQKAIALRKR